MILKKSTTKLCENALVNDPNAAGRGKPRPNEQQICPVGRLRLESENADGTGGKESKRSR